MIIDPDVREKYQRARAAFTHGTELECALFVLLDVIMARIAQLEEAEQ